MNEKTDWKQKGGSKKVHASSPRGSAGKSDYTENGLFKAGLAVAAGLIIAALARGVKNSDYYD